MYTSKIGKFWYPQVDISQIFFPFVDADKDLHDQICKDKTVKHSNVFKRKIVVDQTYTRVWENICKSVVDIDASQIYLVRFGKKCLPGF